MKITIDTERGIFIVPNSFHSTIEKQNKLLKSAGVSDDKLITAKKIIEDAVAEAFKRPVLTVAQARDWNPDLENQIATK